MKPQTLKILFSFTITALTVSTVCAQTEINREVFRVSPPAVYKYIRLMPRPLGTIGSTCQDEGLIYFDENNIVMMCQKRSFYPYALSWAPLPGVWRQEDHNILLTDIRTTQEQKIRVAIGGAPVLALTLNNDGGILAKGELNYGTSMVADTNNLPINTAYPLFLWHAQKGALVAMQTTNSTEFWASYSNYENIIGFNATLFGHANVAKGRGSFVAGEFNKTTGYRSVIGGGQNNEIDVPAAMYDDNLPWTETGNFGIFSAHRHARTTSVIMGGYLNKIYGLFNFIGGGHTNTIDQAIYAAIGGGKENTIDDSISDLYMITTTGGGINGSTAYLDATLSIILGGEKNTITSKGAGIGGGYQNTISSSNRYNAILGGSQNTITGTAQQSAIGGGQENYLNRDYTAVGGGYRNRVTADYSAVISGVPRPSFSSSEFSSFVSGTYGNRISGTYSVIGGGSENTISGQYSVIPGGKQNTISGNYGFIASPLNATIQADFGVVATNKAGLVSGNYGFAAGLDGATASGLYSAALHRSTSIGDFSFTYNPTGSYFASNSGDRSFLFGFGGTIATGNTDAFIIFDQYGSFPIMFAIGKDAPQRTLDVAGTIRTHSLRIQTLETLSSKKPLYFNTEPTPWQLFQQSDIAETFPASESVEPGDVLAADPANPGTLVKSANTYDTSVIGVVSAAPAILFKENQIAALPDSAPEPTTNPAVALAGRVVIKVSAENGRIEPGDLLTTSSQPGTAMKATDFSKAKHAVVAKALQPYNNEDPAGTGFILAIMMVR